MIFPCLFLLPTLALAAGALAMLAVVGLFLLFGVLQLHILFRTPTDPVACPNCGSRDIRKSRAMGQVDLLRKRIGLNPFRCRGCFSRFLSPHSEKTALEAALESETR